MRATLTKGPLWSTAVRRITKAANAHEVLADEVVNGDEPDYHIRWSEPVPGWLRDIITELHYVDPPHDKQLVDHLLSIREKPYTKEVRPASSVGRPTPSARWASRPTTGAV